MISKSLEFAEKSEFSGEKSQKFEKRKKLGLGLWQLYRENLRASNKGTGLLVGTFLSFARRFGSCRRCERDAGWWIDGILREDRLSII
jgi:hypothetical protein